MKMAVLFIVWLYTGMLRLHPTSFQDAFGEEMTAVFKEALSDIQQKGWLSLLIWCGREFTTLFTAIIRQQWLSLSREKAIMSPILSANLAHDDDVERRETPLEIILGIFPFILFGLMFTLKGFDYHVPVTLMGHDIVIYLIVHIILIIGLGIGWVLRFPRWSYAYLGAVVIASGWLAGITATGFRLFGYTFGRGQWGWRGWLPLLALTAVMLLFTRSLQPLAQLFQGIQRDWTRLSFAIYAVLTWLFLDIAYDGKTWYDQTLYLSLNLFLLTLIFSGGAFFYLRGRRQWSRVLALPAAFILHVPISMLVTTLAGYSGSSLTAVGRLVLPLVWLVWASVLLWPGFVTHMWRRFRPA